MDGFIKAIQTIFFTVLFVLNSAVSECQIDTKPIIYNNRADVALENEWYNALNK